jgi:hypothetical protein
MYVIEGDELLIVGHCGECEQTGQLQLTLIEFFSRSPQAVVM